MVRSGSKKPALASVKTGAQLTQSAAMESTGTILNASAFAKGGVPRQTFATFKEEKVGTINSAFVLRTQFRIAPQAWTGTVILKNVGIQGKGVRVLSVKKTSKALGTIINADADSKEIIVIS